MANKLIELTKKYGDLEKALKEEHIVQLKRNDCYESYFIKSIKFETTKYFKDGAFIIEFSNYCLALTRKDYEIFLNAITNGKTVYIVLRENNTYDEIIHVARYGMTFWH